MKQVTRKFRYVAYVFYKDGKKLEDGIVVLHERLIPGMPEYSVMEIAAGLQNKNIWDGNFFKCFSLSTDKDTILRKKIQLKADRVVRVIREGEVSGYVYK